MKTIKVLVLVVAIALAGCTKSIDGRYVVVEVKGKDNNLTSLPECKSNSTKRRGATIVSYLQSHMKGKKYNIVVKKDFAILTDIDENEYTILPLKSDQDGDVYTTKINKAGGESFTIQLRPNVEGKVLLIVDVIASNPIRYTPTQIGGSMVGTPYPNCGRAICYLGKLD